MSYLLYLGGFSPALARLYLRLALRLCLQAGLGPSLLLHPLDFLGGDEIPELAFFPAMRRPVELKLREVAEHLAALCDRFTVVGLGEHADALLGAAGESL